MTKPEVLNVPKQAIIYAAGQLLSRGAAFLLIPLYTRYLTQDEYGVLGVAAAITGVMGIILGFGLEEAVVRFSFDESRSRQRQIWGTLWLFLTGAGLSITLLIHFFASRAAHAVFPAIPFDPYIKLVIWTSFFTLASVIPLALFRARQRASSYVLFSAGNFVVTLVLTLYLVVIRREGARGALTAPLVSAAIFAIPYTVITFRNAAIAFRRTYIAAALAFALPLVPHSLAGWALNLSDRILLQRFVPLGEVSVYYLGYQIGLLLSLLTIALNNAWRPFFYRTVVNEGARAPLALSRLSTYGIAATALAGLVIAAFAREAVTLLAPKDYERASAVSGPVVLAFVLQGVYFFAVNGLFAAKKTAPLPLVTAAAAVSNIALNLLLIPRFGIMAAAWTTAAGFAIALAGAWIMSQRAYPIPYERGRLALIFVVTAVAAVGARSVHLPVLPALGVKLVIVAAAPLALWYGGFVPKRDRELLKSYAAALVARPRRGEA